MPTLDRADTVFPERNCSYLKRNVRTARRREKEKRDMLLQDLAFDLVLLRPIHPEHVSGDFAGVGPGWASCPPVQGLVAVQHDPDVLRLVFVPGGVGISEEIGRASCRERGESCAGTRHREVSSGGGSRR